MTTPVVLHGCEKKGVPGKGICKSMKTKEPISGRATKREGVSGWEGSKGERRRASAGKQERSVVIWAGTRATMVKGSAGVFEK